MVLIRAFVAPLARSGIFPRRPAGRSSAGVSFGSGAVEVSDSETAPPPNAPRPPAVALAQLGRPSLEQRLWSASGIVIMVVLWQLGVSTGALPARFISSPVTVVETAIAMVAHGDLLHDIRVTLTEFFLGMAAAIAVGIPVGLVAGWYRRVRYAVEPYLAARYATPSLALLPLLVLWFGIGIKSTIVLVIISAVFPIIINVMQGVLTVDATYLRMARSFGAHQLRIFATIVLPATVPFLASGLQ